MNVTDVRDIDWDQKIFWALAMPLTLTILGIAIIYGYEWETVRDTLKGLSKRPEPTEAHSIIDEDLVPLR